ncbi:hypothetical protein J2X69_003980 [Algoriphagus sp. 4150]|nr:hypothetical protein [Algoriphagus sp. 4150]
MVKYVAIILYCTNGYSSNYSLVSGSTALIPNIDDCYVTTTSGAVISLVATNSCASSSPYYFYISASGSQLSIYSNPASETLTLELLNTDIRQTYLQK